MTVTRRLAIGLIAFSGLTRFSLFEGIAGAASKNQGTAMTKNLDDGLLVDRIRSDRNGETHFSKCRIPMSPDAKPAGISGSIGIASKDVTFWDFPAGLDVQGARPPGPQFVVVLFGEVKVTVSDGESRSFRSGEMILATDSGPGKGHRTQTVGGPTRVFYVPIDDDVDLDAWTISGS